MPARSSCGPRARSTPTTRTTPAIESNSRGDYHTVGDVAYWDDEGYLYICDRKTDMIISGGMNIYPAEIEAALEQHPEIYDVAVFGIPSEEWGEVVHATVVRSPGSSLTGEEITAFAREHLASYKVPRSVDFMDELPRTGSGKILKRQLRAPYWAGRSRPGRLALAESNTRQTAPEYQVTRHYSARLGVCRAAPCAYRLVIGGRRCRGIWQWQEPLARR